MYDKSVSTLPVPIAHVLATYLQITPSSGPMEGGTRLVVTGAHLGNWSATPRLQINLGHRQQCRYDNTDVISSER